MTTAAVDALRAALDEFSRGNPAPFMELLAPDVVYTTIGRTQLSGTYRGRDDLMTRLMMPLAGALATPLALHVQQVIADGDRVAAQAVGRATLQSGAPYDNVYCFVFRLAGGVVAEVTEYFDTQYFAQSFGVPADRTRLVRLMDLNMWEMFRDIIRIGRGGELVERPGFTMARSPNANFFHNMVFVRDALDVDELIAAVTAWYGPGATPFSIWTRPHADEAVEAALQARGYMQILSLPAMALLGDPGTRCEPDGLDIRPAVDEQGRRDYLEVTAEAYSTYQQPREMTDDAFASLDSVCAPHIQGFVGYAGGAPVAAAAVYLTHGVAGIGWVGTVSSARGKRYAEAVTWAAVREGFRRGASFASLQASPMGRPVYERMGFITPSEYRVWVGTL
jgi:ketosteroid isomerase-like protein